MASPVVLFQFFFFVFGLNWFFFIICSLSVLFSLGLNGSFTRFFVLWSMKKLCLIAYSVSLWVILIWWLMNIYSITLNNQSILYMLNCLCEYVLDQPTWNINAIQRINFNCSIFFMSTQDADWGFSLWFCFSFESWNTLGFWRVGAWLARRGNGNADKTTNH